MQVQGKMEASLSRIRRLKNKTRDKTGGETGTEAHGGARRSQGGKVILILRIRLHRSCTYIGYVINNNQYATQSTIRRTTSWKHGASTRGYEIGEIQAKLLRFHPFLPTSPTPSLPSPCPKLQKTSTDNQNPRSRHTPFTICLSHYAYLIKSPMTSSRGQRRSLYLDSLIVDKEQLSN